MDRKRLNAEAAAKVTTALYRWGRATFRTLRGLAAASLRTRIDFGRGYRIYFGKDGETLVALLGGSSKKRQQEASRAARSPGGNTSTGRG